MDFIITIFVLFLVCFLAWLFMSQYIDAGIGIMMQRKQSEDKEPGPPIRKIGDYHKYYYCPDCGHAVYDRAVNNVECCAKCGSEKMDKTVGRWEYEWKECPFNLSYYKAIKFHPKTTGDKE